MNQTQVSAEAARHLENRTRTKTVATVGPACDSPEMLAKLACAGVDVFRVNMAHGSREYHQQSVDRIRQISDELGFPTGILVDLAGPKIRLGTLIQDPLPCPEGLELKIVRGNTASNEHELVSNYAPLVDELSPGDPVLLADGTVSLSVVDKDENSVRCVVVGPGQIRSRQGINLPGVALSVPALTDEDLSNAVWAAEAGVDFVSLSFVRTPNEINELKEILAENGSKAMVIAKIEKGEALECLDEIVMASDGIMVARGDLGVEVDVAETPMIQKRIIERCQKFVKPVIVATQMLDSMQRSNRPTRAEVTDVANAILDGADACMLSGETAIGDHPTGAVEMMNRIMRSTERTLATREQNVEEPVAAIAGIHPISSAMVSGACNVAQQLFAQLFVVVTRSGDTARVKAKYRNLTRTLGISDSKTTINQMCLMWGIQPVFYADLLNPPELRQFAVDFGKDIGWLTPGDRVVFASGSQVETNADNVVVVRQVK